MDKFFDKYAWQARIFPALLVLLPIGIAVIAWVPKIEDQVKPVLGILTGAGTLVLLAHLARSAGKRAEERLVAKWGGLPSTLLLRHRDTRIDPVTKRRYHERLAQLVPGLKLSTPAEENADPMAADQAYVSCGNFLRARTRDEKKFPLLLNENISYGFRRNLFGLRPLGLLISLCGVAGCVWKLDQDLQARLPVSPLVVASLLFCVGFAAFWIFVVNAAWVRQAADDYAIRLLETIDQLLTPANPASPASPG
ncbi:MAG TPA: hypothetical protein VK689_18255 [Armatimonadota bacterium]|nr:hypothetical protein [Armatimonadota bacterium]